MGDGLTAEDCAAIGRFHARGGGILATRDHQDLGSSICSLGGVGKAHHFHSHNPEAPASIWRSGSDPDPHPCHRPPDRGNLPPAGRLGWCYVDEVTLDLVGLTTARPEGWRY